MSFLTATQGAIARHGIDLSYTSKSQTGSYNVETGTVSETVTTVTLKMYPKQVIANNYNFPTLIGKEVVMFYLANTGLTLVPKLNDTIIYKTHVYTVQSFQEHLANTQVALYRIIAIRG